MFRHAPSAVRGNYDTLLRRAGIMLALVAVLSGAARANSPAAARAGAQAPAFTLRDTQGRLHSLSEWRGQQVALFFFCGCEPCQRCASLWAQAQDSLGMQRPVTVAVFSGNAAEARTFAAKTHFLGSKTLVLLDTQERTADRYGVAVCPRVFALDARGQVRYTNDEPGSDPQKTPSAALVSRMVTAAEAYSRPLPASSSTAGKRGLHAR